MLALLVRAYFQWGLAITFAVTTTCCSAFFFMWTHWHSFLMVIIMWQMIVFFVAPLLQDTRIRASEKDPHSKVQNICISNQYGGEEVTHTLTTDSREDTHRWMEAFWQHFYDMSEYLLPYKSYRVSLPIPYLYSLSHTLCFQRMLYIIYILHELWNNFFSNIQASGSNAVTT